MRLLQDLLVITALRQPAALAILTPEQAWSYGEIAQLAHDYANVLIAEQLQIGDRVVVLMENGIEFVAGYFGCLLAGTVAVPLNPSTPAFLLRQQIASCSPQAIMPSVRQVSQAHELLDNDHTQCCIINFDKPRQDYTQARLQAERRASRLEPTLPAVIFYTSGSTGAPRGVVLSHRAVLSTTSGIVQSLALGPQDRMMQVLPMHYCYGASMLHSHFSVGASLVLDHRMMYPATVVGTMAATGCTGFAGVPSTFLSLARRDLLSAKRVPTLRYVAQAGGHLAPDIIDRFRSALAPASFYVMYGLTEAGGRVSCLDPDRWSAKRGSVGHPIPGVEVRIKALEGHWAGSRPVGEIQVRGPGLMLGYFGQAEESARVLNDGWLRTGDVGRLDEDGCLYIEDRAERFIKSRGFRISPAHIEDILLTHPDVAEVLVLGIVCQPTEGETPVALVRLLANGNAEIPALLAFCARNLPPPMRPTRIKIVDQLPVTPTGKPALIEARKLFTDDIG